MTPLVAWSLVQFLINIILVALLADANFKANLARLKIEYFKEKSLIDQNHKNRLIDKLIEERTNSSYLANASYLGETE